MAWVSYRHDGADHVGLVDGDHYVPLEGIARIDATTGSAELAAAHPDPAGRVAAADVEPGRETPTYPVLFPEYASSLIAADAPITVPPESDQVDYEGELAVVIGTGGRRIPRERATEHVLGYAVANDVTVRDHQ